VEKASVDVLPANVWSWESPGWRGDTIGSSGARWLNPQTLMKLTPLSGGAVAACPAGVVAIVPVAAATSTQTAIHAWHRSRIEKG
jgi:hypothetical protein